MLYNQPNFKKDKSNGFIEGYNFKETSTINLTVETNVGSGAWESLDVAKEDRVLYLLDGLGFAKISGKTYRLDKNKVLEIPAGMELEMNGQFKFLCISAK